MARNDAKTFHRVIRERIAELKLIIGHDFRNKDAKLRLAEVQNIYYKFYELKKLKVGGLDEPNKNSMD